MNKVDVSVEVKVEVTTWSLWAMVVLIVVVSMMVALVIL
jgi:hypothetical protein